MVHPVARILAGAGLVLWAVGCSGLSRMDAELFPDPPRSAITFWGHASLFIDLNGFGIVTDPVFETDVMPRFRKIPAPPPASYARASVVLISHAHSDHLSPSTLRTFPDAVTILCPAPCEKYLRDVGRRVLVMRPGDVFAYDGGTITAVAAHHPGGRYSLNAESDGRALGYVIQWDQGTIFYAGDSDYFPGFAEVGEHYSPDIAILNVNGHLHDTDALWAASDTRAATIVAAHYGAYGYMGFRTRDEPRDAETLRRVFGDRFIVMQPGESLQLKRPRVLP